MANSTMRCAGCGREIAKGQEFIIRGKAYCLNCRFPIGG